MKEPTACLYPGQSVQRIGIGLDLYRAWPQARRCFDAADDFLGFALSDLCFNGPEDRLNDDSVCQLAVYTHSCAVADIMADHGIRPDFASGYSSGFYAAAYAAGCYTFLEGLDIVKKAGHYLLDCAARVDGAMGVIFGLAPEVVNGFCKQAGDVYPAIFNTPRQTIISGRADKLELVLAKALEHNALDAYRLAAGTAYHSLYMHKAGERLLAAVDQNTLKPPQCDLLSYSTLERVRTPRQLAQTLASQLSSPVRWVEVIGALPANGIQTVFEVGPGRVITRTARWINRNIQVTPLDTAQSLAAVTG